MVCFNCLISICVRLTFNSASFKSFCEVPPVATRVGGLPELVTHGVDGFLAEVGDVEAMAEYTTRLLENPSLYAEVSQAARQTARTRFCASLIIPKYEELYRRVLERSRGSVHAE